MPHLRIGTRGSELAVRQADIVRQLLEERGATAELVRIRTSGDRRTGSAPGEPVKGLFTKELEDALLDNRIDAAVHSLKDLLTSMPDRLMLAAFPERQDPRDALVTRLGDDLSALPPGSRVGTSSPRRRAALLAIRPDLEAVLLSGNVPTRIKRVDDGDLDAVILALAGLRRLGQDDRGRPLDPEVFVPAAGQGALAVQVRTDDPVALDLIEPLDRPEVRQEVLAERTAIRNLEGGCRAPIGALCRNGVLVVTVYAPDGARRLSSTAVVDPSDPEGAGRLAAADLLARGAARLIDVSQMDETLREGQST